VYRDEGDEGFYLHLGRLDEEKGIEAVVAAFAGSDRKLVLCGGEGDAGDEVRAQIDRAPNIDYRGFVSQDEKYRLLATCRALVFNGRNEDFGIIPIEANASGKPVLARDEGFPSLFVEDGENGFLHDGTAEGIAYAVDRLEGADLRRNIASRAEQFLSTSSASSAGPRSKGGSTISDSILKASSALQQRPRLPRTAHSPRLTDTVNGGPLPHRHISCESAS